MNVLVWQSFGLVRVYMAETPTHFFKIHEALSTAMVSWGEEEGLDELFELIDASTSRQQGQRLQEITRRHFLGFIGPHLNTHEAFELFEFTTIEDVRLSTAK